ncbi:unnamed protein product, partial [Ixodes pacificus]
MEDGTNDFHDAGSGGAYNLIDEAASNNLMDAGICLASNLNSLIRSQVVSELSIADVVNLGMGTAGRFFSCPASSANFFDTTWASRKPRACTRSQKTADKSMPEAFESDAV